MAANKVTLIQIASPPVAEVIAAVVLDYAGTVLKRVRRIIIVFIPGPRYLSVCAVINRNLFRQTPEVNAGAG